MNTMTHPVRPEEVMAFVDGELPDVWNEFAAGHIAECKECQDAVAEFRKGAEELHAWKIETMPTRVEERVRAGAKFETSGKAKNGRLWSLRPPVWSKWALGLGFTAVMVLLLGQRNSLEPSRPSHATRDVSKFPQPSNAPLAAKKTYDQALPTYSQALEMRAREQLSSSMAVEREEQTDALQQGPIPNLALEQAPMIARTVSLTLVVKDFAVARTALETILARHHAYAAELSVNTAEGAPRRLTASLRVPTPELGAAVSELKSLGRVENESQSGEEVTQQHADLVARLKNSRETEQRLQAILQQRTGKISDVLQVEQEIARVRGEIEQMEAEQDSLEHRVGFATINLNLADVYQAQLTMPSPSIATRLHNGLVAGFHMAAETVLGIVLFFAEYGPALLIWLAILGVPLFLVWRRYRRSLATV